MLEGLSNKALFEKIHSEYFPYYRSWCHDFPIVVSTKRDRELERLHGILYRACEFYVYHYRDYLNIIPYSDKVLEILDYSSRFPFRAGTFRPDFIIDKNGKILLCEITSRFFANGYFMSYFMERVGSDIAFASGLTDYRSYFDAFFDYMADMCQGDSDEGINKLLVLKSEDKSDSIKLYVPFYQALGLQVNIIEAGKVEENIDLFKDSMIVSALNQQDLLSLSIDTLKKLAENGMRNDFRTIFLLHDKRMFNLFFRDDFTSRFLDQEQTRFLRDHVIRTAIPRVTGQNNDGQVQSNDAELNKDVIMWEDAKKNKDRYILKHHCLGKSEQVYAGPLTDQVEWESLFESGKVNEMILQPFIEQRIYTSTWKGCGMKGKTTPNEEIYPVCESDGYSGYTLREYVSPSILCVDDKYFGCGLFRTSSCAVINQGDAHKMAPLLTDEIDKLGECNIL